MLSRTIAREKCSLNGVTGRGLLLMEPVPGKVDMLKERREEIADYFASHGIPVETRFSRGGLSIYAIAGKTPIARFVPCGSRGGVEVMWYSHRDKWDLISDFGGVTMSAEEALEYVVTDATGCFGIDYLQR